jgi:three-Cys-motif partner protein
LNSKLPGSVPNFKDDGLSITAAEPWFKVKVQLIQSYLQAFIMNASPKADSIIFIDLFSGSGLYSMGHQKDVFAGSCLAALSSSLPFRKWILCEKDAEQAAALDNRTRRFFPHNDVVVLHAAQGLSMEELTSHVPASKAGHHVAVICVVDPFSMEVPISLMHKLSASNYTLLIPFTFVLNERMNATYYVKEQRETLKKFVGESSFEQLSRIDSNLHFYRKLVRLYQNSMLVMGLNTAISSHKLESKLMELPSYCIGFFSREFSTQAIQRNIDVTEHFQYELF